MARHRSPEEALSAIFGGHKAEWLQEEIYALFTAPKYMPELLTDRPCILVGGRGTGKTTVLRCLSYEGQYALSKYEKPQTSWEFVGLYHRINTNRVTAFKEQGKSDVEWRPIYSHYVNLLISELLTKFLVWYTKTYNLQNILPKESIETIALSLCIGSCDNVEDLRSRISRSIIELEIFINNMADVKPPTLSGQSTTMDIYFEAVRSLPCFSDVKFFIIIDEFENLADYQQQIFNTLIKHSGQSYTFKIGVRELGWRERRTLNENEMLISPSDYSLIEIAKKLQGKEFSEFAKKVCNERLFKLKDIVKDMFTDISKALCSLSDEEEAVKLGVEDIIKLYAGDIHKVLKKSQEQSFYSLPPLEQYALIYLASDSNGIDWKSVIRCLSDSTWPTRYQNYKHSILFTIASKKPGIKKYYSGWSTFVGLSGGNIRYLLELVEQSLLLHKWEPFQKVVSCETQTKAAIAIAKKHLSELEGLSVQGAQLTKLLLSLGRVFGLLAEEPRGTAPELTQFEIKFIGTSNVKRVIALLKAAVMNLAILRFHGSKLSSKSSIRDHDYMIHPIYCPFFTYSYRKKRKLTLDETQIVELIDTPKSGINKILASKNLHSDTQLPSQLSLFSGYYSNEN